MYSTAQVQACAVFVFFKVKQKLLISGSSGLSRDTGACVTFDKEGLCG